MSRRRAPVPPARLNLALPRDTKDRMELILYSAAKGGVPVGAPGKFITELLNSYLRGGLNMTRDSDDNYIYDKLRLIRDASISPGVPHDAALRRITEWAEQLLQTFHEEPANAERLQPLPPTNPAAPRGAEAQGPRRD